MPGRSSSGFFARPRNTGGGAEHRPEADSSPERTVGPSRFREEALQAASVSRELGPPMERAGFARPSRPAGRGDLRLRTRRGRPVPVLLQSHASDCGPASLMMALRHYGIRVSLEQLRQDIGGGRDGVSARSLLVAARAYGLPGRGVRTSLEGLRNLPSGSILFWKFNHFVVLERATRQYVYIVDPAYGRRRLSTQDVSRLFTGVVLEFDAPLRSAPRPSSAEAPPSPWRHLAYFFPRSKKWLFLAAASLAILVFGLLAPMSSAYVVDHRGLGGELTPVQAALVVALSALSFFICQMVRGTVILGLQTAAEKRVTLGVFNRLLALPYDYFARREPGDLALRVRTGTSVRTVLTASVLSAAFDGVLVCCYLAGFFLISLQVALWVSLLAMIEIGLLLLAWRPQVYMAADELECQAHSHSGLNEILDGIATVKAGGLDEMLGGRWTHSLMEEINAGTRRRRHFTLFSSLVTSLQFMAPLLVLVTSAFKVSAGQLSLGEMTAFTALSMGVFTPLSSLVLAGFEVAELKAPLTRVGDILDAEPDEPAGMAKSRFDAGAPRSGQRGAIPVPGRHDPGPDGHRPDYPRRELRRIPGCLRMRQVHAGHDPFGAVPS